MSSARTKYSRKTFNQAENQQDKLPQLAVFDIDGTITKPHSSIIEKPMLDGLFHLRDHHVITTVCTGRPFLRMKEALGEHYDLIISDDALISVEHGAKIVNKKGDLVTQTEFGEGDLQMIADFIGANLDMVEYAWFTPDSASKRTLVWSPEPDALKEIEAKRGHYADIFSANMPELKRRLLKQPLSSLSVKLKPHIRVENLQLEFAQMACRIILQDGNMEFIKSRVNKARAITYIRRHLGIFEHHLLVAGNAINDVDMLNMEAGHRILVGPNGPQRDTILAYLYGLEYMTMVDTPSDLGKFLQGLR